MSHEHLEDSMLEVLVRIRSEDGQRTGAGTTVFVEVDGVEYRVAGARHVAVHPIGPGELLQATITTAVGLG